MDLKRRTLTALLLGIGLFFAIPLAYAAGQERGGQLKKVRVSYSSQAAIFAPAVIAQQKGFYQEEGFQVEMIRIRGDASVMAALAGEIDYMLGAGSAFSASLRGVPLKIVMLFYDRPFQVLVTQPEIKAIQALKGKVIALNSLEGAAAVTVKRVLKAGGLDPDADASYVAIGGTDLRYMALKTKKVYGAALDLPYNKLAQREGFSLFPITGFHSVSVGVAVTERKLKDQASEVLRFLRATLKGLRYFRENKSGSLPILAKFLSTSDAVLVELSHDGTRELTTDHGMVSDEFQRAAVQEMREILKVGGDETRPVFDFSLLRSIVIE